MSDVVELQTAGSSGDAPLVLHVDDDPGIVDLAATFLGREGLDVVTATDAEAGLELLDERPIDCVVSDYDMPVTDGLEFLAAVRERDADLPFILFTGKGSEEIASEAISRGVTDYLQKEVGTDQYAVLANRIEESVRRYRAETALVEARRRYETLLANLPGMAYRCTTEPGWPMAFVSEGSRALTGYDPAAITSGEVDWEADVIVEADREPVRRSVEAAVAAGEPFEVTYRIRRLDGRIRWAWEQGRAVEETDRGRVLEGFITDVTARERNERELRAVSATQRAVLGRVAEGIVVVDLEDGTVVRANERAARMTGRGGSELAGVGADELLDSGEVGVDELADAGSFERELSVATGAGETVALHASGRTVDSEDHRRLVLVLSGSSDE